MDIFTSLLLIVIALLLLDYVIKPKLNLPCPKRLPLIGNILSIKGKTHLILSEWAKTYGSMFAVQVFTETFVVLNDYESIYECLVKKGIDFAGRPQTFRTYVLTKNMDIVVQEYTQSLKLMKMRVMTLMKEYDKGKDNIDDIVLDISKECVHKLLDGEMENIIDPYAQIFLSVSKTSALLLSGIKYEDGHQFLKKWIEIEKVCVENFDVEQGVELDAFPWLRFFNTKNYQKLKKVPDAVNDIFDDVKREYEKSDSGDKKRTVAFGLLDMLENKQNDETFNEDRIKYALMDLIIAGTCSSTSSFQLIVLILACKPAMQQKIYEEVQVVLKYKVDKQRICIEDKHKMPYTRAFLLEALRYGSVSPLSVTHKATIDSELMGKRIPKGTMVLPNLWNLHHSEQYWEDPWSFKPERFLDQEGKLVASDHINRKHLMPFGAGKRVCVGQSLAMARLFIFLTTFVQETRIETVPGLDVNPDVRSFKFKLIVHPEPYMVKFIKRH